MGAKRSEFSVNVRLAAAARAGGQCEKCGTRLRSGAYHYDHKIPLGLDGDSSLANCQVLCRPCHAIKTRADVKPMVKADQTRKRVVLGIKPKSRPIQNRPPKPRRSPEKRSLPPRPLYR